MNPRKLYGTSQAVRVNISSIVLNKNAAGAPIGATVRIERRVVNKGNGSWTALDNKIITMMFAYKNNLKIDRKRRRLNSSHQCVSRLPYSARTKQNSQLPKRLPHR